MTGMKKTQSQKKSNAVGNANESTKQTKQKKKASGTAKKYNGWTIFMQEKRAEVLANATEKQTMGDVSRELGRLWNELSTSEQQVYKDKAKQKNQLNEHTSSSDSASVEHAGNNTRSTALQRRQRSSSSANSSDM